MSGDGRLVRVRLKFERDFTQIPNEWLRDANLSLRARGLLALLMSHEANYVVTFNSLAATNREGTAAIRSAVAELREHGYLEIQRMRRRDGAIEGSVWLLTDPEERKSRSQPKLDFPHVAEPHVAEPHVDNPRLKEEQLKEHLQELNKPTIDAGASKKDGLPADSHSDASESPAGEYSRLIAAKCPGRRTGPHIWLESGYCEWCGIRQPSFFAPEIDLATTGVLA